MYYAVSLWCLNMQDEINSSICTGILIVEVIIVLCVDLFPFNIFKYRKNNFPLA